MNIAIIALNCYNTLANKAKLRDSWARLVKDQNPKYKGRYDY